MHDTRLDPGLQTPVYTPVYEPFHLTVDNPETEEKCVHYVECPPDECKNSLHVRYEIDYWRFRRTAESKAWHSLQDM
jgi:hypothetical protein